MLRRRALAPAVAAVLLVGAAAPSGAFPTGYSVSPTTTVETGEFVTLTATLAGDVCDDELRFSLLPPGATPDADPLIDNGNGGAEGATQILLDVQGEGLVLEPATYLLRVTCGGTVVSELTPFEVTEVAQEEPPAEEPTDTAPPAAAPPAAAPVAAAPTFTG